MTEPATLSDPEIPKITLAGKEWPVPKLAVRQNRIVVPRVTSLAPLLASLGANTIPAISEAQFDNLVECIYQALTRAHPTLTREEFQDMEVGTLELFLAFPVVAEQTGMMKRKAAKDAAPGEEEGSRRTGTE